MTRRRLAENPQLKRVDDYIFALWSLRSGLTDADRPEASVLGDIERQAGGLLEAIKMARHDGRAGVKS